MTGSAIVCTTSTPRWMRCAVCYPPSQMTPNLQRSRRCASPTTTSGH
ncbi:hypothetical protein LEMLEM_LOCUS13703 [Lemmus lemmus]